MAPIALDSPDTDGFPPSLGEFRNQLMELTLDLPSWQVVALEKMAQRHGLTIGQLLRRLISDLVQQQAVAGQ